MSSHERSWDCTEHNFKRSIVKILGTTKVKKTKTSWEGLVEDVKVRILIILG